MKNEIVNAINSIVDEYVDYQIIGEEPLQIINLGENKISIRIDVEHNGELKAIKLPKEPKYFLYEDELEVYNNLIPDEFKSIFFIKTMVNHCKRTRNTYYNVLKRLSSLDYIGFNYKTKLYYKK